MTHLTGAIENLIDNALKYCNGSCFIQIKVFRNGHGPEITVTDNGIGIRPEDLPRLFREFEQLDTGTARKYEGTGLGLALTKKLVEIQEGHIDVESEHGKGSTFSVTLPRALRAPHPEVFPKMAEANNQA